MIRFPPFKVIYKRKNSKMIEYKSVPLYLSTRPRTKKLYNSVIDMISENKIKELEEKLAGFQKKGKNFWYINLLMDTPFCTRKIKPHPAAPWRT